MSSVMPLLAYAVRALGMFVVFSVATFLLFSSLAGGKLLASSGCCLVMASAVLSWPRIPNAWRTDPPTDRQLAYAIKLGIDIPQGASKGQLSDLIEQARQR